MKPEYLPRDAVTKIVAFLSQKYPDVFSHDRVQVVGVDIAPKWIHDITSKPVEAVNGFFELPPGIYRVGFGFEMPPEIQTAGIRPELYERSSNRRCGAGIDSFLSSSTQSDEAELFGGEICALYRVWNRYGIHIEKGACMAQLCFRLPTHELPLLSEPLHPARIEMFAGRGTIGKGKTVAAPTRAVPLHEGKWNLAKDVPYLITFKGIVDLRNDEVIVPTFHYADLPKYPKMLPFTKYSCLGDPGYQGELGIVVVPMLDITITPDEGIARVQKHRVWQYGQLEKYHGQWVEHPPRDARRIVFASPEEWGLVGVKGKSLEELMAAAVR